eukprot:COSAG02_NODE_10144_length_2011_cov_1.116109_2_plen_65_part_00
MPTDATGVDVCHLIVVDAIAVARGLTPIHHIVVIVGVKDRESAAAHGRDRRGQNYGTTTELYAP